MRRRTLVTVLLKSEKESKPTYSPDLLYTRMQGIRELLENNDRDDSIELQSEIEEDSDAHSALIAYRLSLIEDAIDWTFSQ